MLLKPEEKNGELPLPGTIANNANYGYRHSSELHGKRQ
jgi:hypothetical protein